MAVRAAEQVETARDAENARPSDRVGCTRVLTLRDGSTVREQLLGLSDFDLFCTSSILESSMGVENYVATLRRPV